MRVKLTCDECGEELVFEAQRPMYHVVTEGQAPIAYFKTLECGCGKLLIATLKMEAPEEKIIFPQTLTTEKLSESNNVPNV